MKKKDKLNYIREDKNMFENIIRVLNDFGKLLVEDYKDALVKNGVNTTQKTLYNSVSYFVEHNNTTFEVKLSLEDYWIYVEKGRKAGKFPPFNAIKKWVEIKPIIPRPFNNGKLPTINQLTYLIQRKIGLEGIEPRPLLTTTIDNLIDNMIVELQQALEQDCKKLINIELLQLP